MRGGHVRLLYLFSDFTWNGPYVGQMRARAAASLPGGTIIDLMHDAAAQDPKSASYLLAALAADMPPDAVCVAVVDPGVGTSRAPLVMTAGERVFVGPDNGLLEIPARRAAAPAWHRISWRPESLSASFHGRDLFAPAAARIAKHGSAWIAQHATPLGAARRTAGGDWPDDLSEVIYIDGFGNAMTGLRADLRPPGKSLSVNGFRFAAAETFGAVAAGEPFWYRNSIGLVEIAVNQGRADRALSLDIGTAIEFAD